MRKGLNPDSHRPKKRTYLFFPVVSVLTPKILSVLTVVLGTACTLTLASKPQQAPKLATSIERAVKPPIVQPKMSGTVTNILSQGNQPNKEAARVLHPPKVIAPRSLSPASSSLEYANIPLTPNRLQSQKRQQPSNNRWQRLGTGIKRSLHPQAQTKPSPQVAIGSQTSSNIALNQAQAPQNQQPHPTAPLISQAPLPEQPQPAPEVETKPEQNQQPPAPAAQIVQLKLSDVVVLALENNRPIKNAYLERIVQRQELAVAEDKFSPNVTPSVSISLSQFGSDRARSNGDVGLEAIVKVPTGGELSFRWAANSQTSNLNDFGIDTDDDFGQNLRLSFNQPLLRGAGVEVNRASIDIARLTEQINILDLKSTLIDTITDAILAYRELLRAQERLKIAQLSLKSAQESLEINRILIEAGRLAPVDIVQSETELANRQVSLVEAENNLDEARLALLNILDIEQNITIVLAETPTASPVSLDSNKLKQLAFENQPEYLKAQLDIERTRLALLQAENNRLWDLSINTSLGNASNDTADVRAELLLSRELGDLTVERDFQRSRINRLQAENNLEEERESLDIQLVDNIRNVNLSFSQLELARKATELSERQLEIAREKQRLGRPITVFEIIGLQDDLVQARNVELNATIDYLNALTRLDRTLGTTLDTWQVTVETK